MRRAQYWCLAVLLAVPAGSAWSWTLPAPVAVTGEDSLDPRLGVDAQGRAYVVWRERINGGLFQIWYTDNGSGAFTAPIEISQGGSTGAGSPVVCVDGDNVHTAWIASPDDNFEIWYRRRTSGTWGGIVNASNTSIKSLRPVIAARGSIGPLVAWDEALYADDNYDTFLAEWTGAGFGPAMNVSSTPWGVGYGSVNVNMAIAPNGDLTLAWADRISGNYHVNARRRVGGVWQARQELSTLQTGPATPGIAVSPDNRVHVVYEAEGTIWYQAWTGSAWTTPSALPGGLDSGIRPKIAVDESGVACVVVDAFTGNGYNRDIYWTTNLSGTWAAWSNLSNSPATASLTPDIGYGAGILAVTWLENSDGAGGTGNYDVWHVFGPRLAGGPFGTLAGRVCDASGRGVSGAVVDVGGLYQVRSGADGTYTMGGLPAGTRQATASKAWYTSDTAGITIIAGSTVNRDFRLSVIPPAAVGDLVVTAGNTANTLTWANPGSGNFTGTLVRARTDGYPGGPADGVLVADRSAAPGSTDLATHSGLQNGTRWYYALFAYTGSVDRVYAQPALGIAVPFGPADADHDGDVDQSDFGVFQACLTGSFVPQADPACRIARLDGDDDVDQDDTALFVGCQSGPGRLSDPLCNR